MQVTTKNGQLLALEKDLAGGGEARIWTVSGQPNVVAKIYHQPTSAHHAKLEAMLANPPTQPSTHTAIAWPLERLYQPVGFIGFLMPRIQGSDTIINYYHPVKRKQRCPQFNWLYLHRTAFNLAVAAEAIHAKGHVFGDINESNILVNEHALVTFVDTDSFQVIDQRGKVYRCPVGKPEYTPPELQGIDFKTIDRKIEHDLFGLAILTFYLLMEGFHPFTGVLPGYMSIGRVDLYCIKHGLFSYHPHGLSSRKNPAVKPPPGAPQFQILHPDLQARFVQCFVNGHQSPDQRPTAKEWKQALQTAEKALISCPVDSLHVYSNHLSACPWCSPRQSQQLSHSPTLGQQQPLPAASQTSRAVTPANYVSPQRPLSSKTRDWGWWGQWIVANTFCWTGAFWLLDKAYELAWDITFSLFKTAGRPVTLFLFGILFGSVIGGAQWVVLRRRILKPIWWWGGATALSCGLLRIMPGAGNTPSGQALSGLVVGLTQWLVLRNQVQRHYWWIPLSGFGWAVGSLASQWAIQHNFPPVFSGQWAIMRTMFTGFGYALITGTLLLQQSPKLNP